jgi:hypothetical protein
MRLAIAAFALAAGAWGGMPDGGNPGDATPPARPSASASAPTASEPAKSTNEAASHSSQPSSSPSLIEKPEATKPGDTTEVEGKGPDPSVNPRLQGRAALPDSVQDAPMLVPNAPKQPPPGNENSPGTGR